MKAVGLLSGGLDSTVATQLMLDRGIEVFTFNLVTMFCCCTPRELSCSASDRCRSGETPCRSSTGNRGSRATWSGRSQRGFWSPRSPRRRAG
ncbi:MAG: hypothetical protein KAW67_00390 [Candidatus Eisenbacteria sp.]|nr:hypothetical protein [Candidatus Eisenbacteria bacterium]